MLAYLHEVHEAADANASLANLLCPWQFPSTFLTQCSVFVKIYVFSHRICCCQFKKQCDQYFYLPSRAEYRGVGGLFYDGVKMPESRLMEFQARMLSESLQAYLPILEENASIPWTATQKRWQRIRRGRYIEFNLLNDRGVQFGLAGGNPSRTEAIMISAPPSIEWPYNFVPEPSSPEEKTLRLLNGEPVEWAEL